MILIGLDISTVATGVAIFDDNILLHSETINTSSKKLDMPAKQKLILNRIRTLIQQYKPQYAIIEEVFSGQNRKVGLILSEIHGLIQSALIDANIKWEKHPTQSIKKLVNGDAKTNAKTIMQQKIIKHFKLPANTDNNSTDSIACVLYYLGITL